MKGSSLPFGYVLGVLNREQAAEYCSVSPSLFDEMVANKRMPPAVELSEKRFGWIQRELDTAIATLPRKDETKGDAAPVGQMSDGERNALERFDAARKAAKAEKYTAKY
jgi:predicted DNA-binding transcriptional regulator AlpA